jgi:hypothetical protein
MEIYLTHKKNISKLENPQPIKYFINSAKMLSKY